MLSALWKLRNACLLAKDSFIDFVAHHHKQPKR